MPIVYEVQRTASQDNGDRSRYDTYEAACESAAEFSQYYGPGITFQVWSTDGDPNNDAYANWNLETEFLDGEEVVD